MKYTPQEVIQFIQEEDVKFIRLCVLRRASADPRTSPSCPTIWNAPSRTALPSTPPPSRASATRCTPTCFSIPTPATIVPAAMAAGARRAWCGCSATITHPDGTPFDPRHPGHCSSRPLPTPRRRATPSPSAPSWNSICSGWTKTARSRTFLTIRPPIWMSRRRTDVKMSAGRSA